MHKKCVLYLLAAAMLLQSGAALASGGAAAPGAVFRAAATAPPAKHAPSFRTPEAPAAAPAATPRPTAPIMTPAHPATPTPVPTPTPQQNAPAAGNTLSSNKARYDAYAAKNPELSYAEVLVAVNLKLDEANYSNVVTVEKPESLTVFVSKHYGLPKSYKPKNLVSVDRRYAQSGVRLRSDCNQAVCAMAQDMEKEGLTLYIKSGYRTNRKRGGPNDLWYVWPGHSEHQTGLAFDLRKKNVTYSTLGEYKYHKTEEYAWLCEHAYKYGFILSYPYNKTDITGIGYEPWHWRYVGVTVATDMKEKGFETYHEYWATHLIQGVMG